MKPLKICSNLQITIGAPENPTYGLNFHYPLSKNPRKPKRIGFISVKSLFLQILTLHQNPGELISKANTKKTF